MPYKQYITHLLIVHACSVLIGSLTPYQFVYNLHLNLNNYFYQLFINRVRFVGLLGSKRNVYKCNYVSSVGRADPYVTKRGICSRFAKRITKSATSITNAYLLKLQLLITSHFHGNRATGAKCVRTSSTRNLQANYS